MGRTFADTLCAALGCPAPAVVVYEAGPVGNPDRIASACRRHRPAVRAWVTDAGRVRRTPLTAPAPAGACSVEPTPICGGAR
ncbi:hypothetical protein AB0M20_43805 [Actinoplanes sp. NPDC051633]|uniref:hypothetical protein n=1 Tax=Actinoplanes sp. NPDC051633 TaxID=3155670 RepID=UPI00343BEBCF